MDQQDEQDVVSDAESDAYLGDDDGNVNEQDQEVADLQGAEAGAEGGAVAKRAKFATILPKQW